MRKSFKLEFKQEVLNFAKSESIEKASKKFSVTTSTIRGWKNNQAKIAEQCAQDGSKRRRLQGGGVKINSQELEELLVDWIKETRNAGHRVSRNMIREKALKEFQSCDDQKTSNFTASLGWLGGFLKRNNFSLRCRTTVAQKDPEEMHEKVASFIAFVSKIRKDYNIQDSNILAMDETPVFSDPAASRTVNECGEKTVSIKTTGHEKDRTTVVLAAKGDGTKLKPFIVFKAAKREVQAMQGTAGVEIASHPNATMDDRLTKEWLDKIVKRMNFQKRLLVWDSFRCHISKSTKSHLSEFNVKMAVIPGGCTKYLQAPDVCWNKPFKDRMTEYYSNWMLDPENMQYTKGGNLKAPPRPLIVQWIKEAWDSLPKQLILDSFKSCALTTDTAGNEDDKIHCIKVGQPCRGAWDILQNYRDLSSETPVNLLEEEEIAEELIIDTDTEEEEN